MATALIVVKPAGFILPTRHCLNDSVMRQRMVATWLMEKVLLDFGIVFRQKVSLNILGHLAA
jgi:hypothetical protein